MLPKPLQVSASTARRFLRRALLLDARVDTIGEALAHHGYIQIDPINVCGRMHDHILRHRVAGYREGDLMRYLHGADAPLPAAQRSGFEHHLPDSNVLVAFPLDAWPHLLAAMNARSRRPGAWSGRLTAREKELAPRLLAELRARGPLGSEDLHDGRRSRRVWGSMTLAKSTLQKLFFHGQILVAGRDHNRRLYDLPEKVLPPAVLRQGPATPAETARWIATLKLRQRRLALLKKTDVAEIPDLLQPLAIEGCSLLYCLRSDLPLLQAAEEESTPISTPPTLLAPLDPLIYDRRLTRQLWGYDYTWEAYTPPHKRVRGYYALPVLSGHELVGHVDPKVDRALRRLIIVSRRLRRGHRVSPSVAELASFLELKARPRRAVRS